MVLKHGHSVAHFPRVEPHRSRILSNRVKAKVESGSAYSYITPEAAREVGVDPGGPDAKSAGDISGLATKPIPTWIGRFNTFEVGGETIENARLLIGQLSSPGKTEYSGTRIPQRVRAPEVFLGADFLKAHRIVVVPEKQVALFTYNGGAVFRTNQAE